MTIPKMAKAIAIKKIFVFDGQATVTDGKVTILCPFDGKNGAINVAALEAAWETNQVPYYLEDVVESTKRPYQKEPIFRFTISDVKEFKNRLASCMLIINNKKAMPIVDID